jgi:hypothetical protein
MRGPADAAKRESTPRAFIDHYEGSAGVPITETTSLVGKHPFRANRPPPSQSEQPKRRIATFCSYTKGLAATLVELTQRPQSGQPSRCRRMTSPSDRLKVRLEQLNRQREKAHELEDRRVRAGAARRAPVRRTVMLPSSENQALSECVGPPQSNWGCLESPGRTYCGCSSSLCSRTLRWPASCVPTWSPTEGAAEPFHRVLAAGLSPPWGQHLDSSSRLAA